VAAIKLYHLLICCKDEDPNLLRGYVKLRESLKDAKLKKKRLIGPIPSSLKSHEKAVEWLYSVLSVLDAKASALMRLNGVMLAAAAFLLNLDVSYLELVLWGIAALSSISIALCLLVVSVDWPFLGLVRQTGENLDFTDEVDNLERVSVFRQTIYRISWITSSIATAMFVYAFACKIFNLVTTNT
jgi:hypothetical protein